MDNLEKQIDDALIELDAPFRFSGTIYIKECLMFMLTDTYCRIKLGRCFEKVAQKLFGEYNIGNYRTMSRNTRYAIEYIIKHLSEDKRQRVFGITAKEHLKSKEFLIRLCRYIENNQV